MTCDVEWLLRLPMPRGLSTDERTRFRSMIDIGRWYYSHASIRMALPLDIRPTCPHPSLGIRNHANVDIVSLQPQPVWVTLRIRVLRHGRLVMFAASFVVYAVYQCPRRPSSCQPRALLHIYSRFSTLSNPASHTRRLYSIR